MLLAILENSEKQNGRDTNIKRQEKVWINSYFERSIDVHNDDCRDLSFFTTNSKRIYIIIKVITKKSRKVALFPKRNNSKFNITTILLLYYSILDIFYLTHLGILNKIYILGIVKFKDLEVVI
ncbi:MAG TPA: hypothetical protein ENI51_10780 [Candidatus Atribacteria bacterium]|nr:hypothetical protein [Candidatus Atribacteria bacterium]